MTRDFAVVLVSPRDPNNIGAAARAMANFGLTDLRVVTPYAPSWRDAVSAVGAQDIMQSARLFDSLPQALSDCVLTLATTALKNRRLDQPVIALPDLPAWLAGQMHLSFGAALTAGVIPYLPGDAAKIILAALAGPKLSTAVRII